MNNEYRNRFILASGNTHGHVVISAPVLSGALIIGLSVAIFQAATSIQEMTLSYVPKMVVAVIILFFSFGFMLQYAIDFMLRIFEFIPQISN